MKIKYKKVIKWLLITFLFLTISLGYTYWYCANNPITDCEQCLEGKKGGH